MRHCKSNIPAFFIISGPENKHTPTLCVPVIGVYRPAALHLTVPLYGREEEPSGVSRETQTRRPPLRTGTQSASNDERGETLV